MISYNLFIHEFGEILKRNICFLFPYLNIHGAWKNILNSHLKHFFVEYFTKYAKYDNNKNMYIDFFKIHYILCGSQVSFINSKSCGYSFKFFVLFRNFHKIYEKGQRRIQGRSRGGGVWNPNIFKVFFPFLYHFHNVFPATHPEF